MVGKVAQDRVAGDISLIKNAKPAGENNALSFGEHIHPKRRP